MNRWFPRCLAAMLAVLVLPAAAAGFTPEEQEGRRIYREGVSPSGSLIKVLVGPDSTEVPPEALTCAGCHGEDGLGRPEGAVRPSNIRWSELSKPYGHRHEDGREHPAFDERTVAESLTAGRDPAGNKLDPSMPRYVMSNRDISNLIAYLKKIEIDYDPGVSPGQLRIGLLVPAKGRMGEVGGAVAGLIGSHVDGINASGGIFGRKIELVTAEFAEDPKAALGNARKLAREQDVFALVSPFAIGIEQELAALAEEAKIPVVGPFTLSPGSTLVVNRYTFYLLPGLREQAAALAKFATAELKIHKPVVAIVYPEGEGQAAIAESAEEQFKAGGWDSLHRHPYPARQQPDGRLVAAMQQRGVQVILFLGSDADLDAMGKQVRDAIWSPYLLAPGTQVARAAIGLPNTFGDRVYLSFPTQPRDVTPKAAAALAELDRKRNLGTRHVAAQLSAYASVLVLEEGLKRAGRDLSRAKLVDSLENLFSFESGVTPALSYGPNRRIGALGAHVLRVDLGAKTFRSLGKYIRLD